MQGCTFARLNLIPCKDLLDDAIKLITEATFERLLPGQARAPVERLEARKCDCGRPRLAASPRLRRRPAPLPAAAVGATAPPASVSMSAAPPHVAAARDSGCAAAARGGAAFPRAPACCAAATGWPNASGANGACLTVAAGLGKPAAGGCTPTASPMALRRFSAAAAEAAAVEVRLAPRGPYKPSRRRPQTRLVGACTYLFLRHLRFLIERTCSFRAHAHPRRTLLLQRMSARF